MPKQNRSQNNRGHGQIRAPGKQRLGTNEVPGWVRSTNEPISSEKWVPWNTKALGQMSFPNEWSPPNKHYNVPRQTRSLNKNGPNKCGPPTNKFSQRTRSPTVKVHQQTIMRMNKYIYELPRGPNSNSGSHTEVIMSRVNKFTRKTISREYTKTSTVQLSPLCLLKLVLITTVLSNLLKS